MKDFVKITAYILHILAMLLFMFGEHYGLPIELAIMVESVAIFSKIK